MKFKGLKHLNSNLYDYIMIRNFKDEVTVESKNTLNIPTIKTNNTFYNSIKNLNEKDKISEIIRYYLRNNKIRCIKKGEIARYLDNFMIVEGERDLYLQLDKEQIDVNILNEILEKYKIDREKYLTKKDFKNIEITCDPYSGFKYGYYKNEDNYDEHLCVHLNMKNNDLIDFEKKFFEDYINYLLSKTDEIIDIDYVSYNYRYFDYYKRRFEDQGGYYLKCSKFIVRLDRDLFYKIYPIITSRNVKIKDSKKLQLKLH